MTSKELEIAIKPIYFSSKDIRSFLNQNDLYILYIQCNTFPIFKESTNFAFPSKDLMGFLHCNIETVTASDSLKNIPNCYNYY